MQSKQFSLRFLKKLQVAQDTYSFYFDRQQTDYDFLPGQYNQVSLPMIISDGHSTSRFFTVASSPLEKEYLMITTKTGKSDFKKRMFVLQKDEQIQFFGPIGGFVFRDEESSEHVFLAGGIGITPFRSMIVYVVEEKLSTRITLYASFPTPEEVVYYDELTAIAKEHPNIKIIYTITKPNESQIAWDGETGRISEELIRKYIPDITKPTYYIVGPPPMVDGAEELLGKMAIEEGKIKIEQFTGY